jgi:hypothetical protein
MILATQSLQLVVRGGPVKVAAPPPCALAWPGQLNIMAHAGAPTKGKPAPVPRLSDPPIDIMIIRTGAGIHMGYMPGATPVNGGRTREAGGHAAAGNACKALP